MNDAAALLPQALARILDEVFTGAGAEGYLLNPDDPGLLGQLDVIDARQASTRPMPGKTTIAAHANHVHHLLTLLNRWASGETPLWADADWEASWQRGTMTDAEWSELRSKLRHEFERWGEAVATRPEWDQASAAAAISSAAHVAYHFGAIRQILAAIEAN